MTTFESIIGRHMARHGLLPVDGTIGVALSGGADSCSLLIALHNLGYNVVALHCNFHLRGEESDADEQHCHALASRLTCKIATCDVNVERDRLKGESIEMTCRRTRYDWFETCAKSLNLKAIAIAHNRNDMAETVLLNLMRGTGIKGLRGMPERRGIYVRPMLTINRSEIEQYLLSKGETWQIDSTNATDAYRRNALRNVVIPAMEKYFPDAIDGIIATASAASEANGNLNQLARTMVQLYANDDSLCVSHFHRDDCDLLVRTVAAAMHLTISHDTARSILTDTINRSAEFATTEGITLELHNGILSPVVEPMPDVTIEFDIDKGSTAPYIESHRLDSCDIRRIEKTPFKLYLDGRITGESHHFTLRHPRIGDRMQPFGMKGTRLVSDILKESHIAPSARRNVWLLTCDDAILWIVGLRASNLYRITDSTTNAIILHYNSK